MKLILILAVLLVVALGVVFRKDKAETVGGTNNNNAMNNNENNGLSDVNTKSTWPHEESDIPLNPALRVGQLENGFKYMILRHPWPPGKLSLRLHFDVGSLQEDDDQLG